MNKDELFLYLCEQTAAVPFAYDPKIYSIPLLAQQLNTTKYNIRKLIKHLEAENLVCKNYIGGMNEDGEIGCYHGWSLTDAACETEIYKQCEIAALEEYKRFCQSEYDDMDNSEMSESEVS